MSDARKRAKEALAFMDAALLDEMPPLPTQVKALADAVRALLAAGPEAGVREAFVSGAVWREYDEHGATIWTSDRRRAEEEAERRYPTAEWICNTVCLCGCPDSEHESYDEDGESCEQDDHECIRVAPAVLEIVNRYRVALSAALAAQPPSDAVREAAERYRAAREQFAQSRVSYDGEAYDDAAHALANRVLAALSSPPAAPARDEVTEAGLAAIAARGGE